MSPSSNMIMRSRRLENGPIYPIDSLSGSSSIVVAGGCRGNSPACRLTGNMECFTAKIEPTLCDRRQERVLQLKSCRKALMELLCFFPAFHSRELDHARTLSRNFSPSRTYQRVSMRWNILQNSSVSTLLGELSAGSSDTTSADFFDWYERVRTKMAPVHAYLTDKWF